MATATVRAPLRTPSLDAIPGLSKKMNWGQVITIAAVGSFIVLEVVALYFFLTPGIDETPLITDDPVDTNQYQHALAIGALCTKPATKEFPVPRCERPDGYVNGIDFSIIGMLVLVGPLGFWLDAQKQKIKDIESRIPELLRDIAESGRFGMTLAASIQAAAKGKYGPLTPEIKRMAYQIAWGVPAVEALRLFQERLNTPLVNRVVGIVVKAANAGGNVADVLTLVSEETKESQIAEDERRIAMMTYIAVIYIAFFVFLATVLILNSVFIPQIKKFVLQTPTTTDTGQAATTVRATVITGRDIVTIQNQYLAAAIVHGVGDGIVAGVLDTGRIANGMKHSFILVISAFVMLRLLPLFSGG